MKKLILLILLNFTFCVLNSFCFAQNSNSVGERSRTTDSLLTLLSTTKQDTTKVNTYNQLFFEYEFSDDAKARENLNKALALAQKIDYKKGLAATFTHLGYFAEDKGNYQEALKNYFAALKTQGNIGDKGGMSVLLNNIGNIFDNQGNYPEALKNHLASLKIKEEIDDRKGISASYNNIGLIYMHQNNYTFALKNYVAALTIMEKMKDNENLGYTYSNIGNIYLLLGDYPEALQKHYASLKIFEMMKNEQGKAFSYNNIGATYYSKGNYVEALKNHFASLKIRKDIGDKQGIASSYINLGNCKTKLNKLEEARNYFNNGLQMAKEIGNKVEITNSYDGLASIDSTQGNFKGAYENHKLYILYRDSLDNEQTRKKTVQSQMTYDFEKKELATKAEQDKKDAVTAEESRRQRLFLCFVTVIAMAVAAIAAIVFRSLRITKKQKQIIEIQKEKVEVQNEEITKQKQIVEEKNHEISSSISYAKRIQRSFLTSPSIIKRHLPDHFILFKPRDVVSGDFYWMHQQGDYSYFCVADCTGHGIPGAFMSLIGMGVLNEIVYSKNIIDTNDILNELRRIVILAVNPEDATEEGKDGMDLVYLRFHLPTKELQYSAANNSFYICRKGELLECKPDKMPVGKFGEHEKPFKQHTVTLETDDIIYAITDGYADQFGGPKGKKFKYKQFEELLLSNSLKEMEIQKQNLNTAFENWKGDLEQVDDITVVGIRV